MERRTTSSTAPSSRPGATARAGGMRPGVRSTAPLLLLNNNNNNNNNTTTRFGHGRPGSFTASSRSADRAGAASPAESLMSVATTATAGGGHKRKERDFDAADVVGGEATNINVVVRCRGRNEREVRENSAVVVRAEGVKGKLVELSMGPNALSNKTYHFDRVFSQAADQSMIFDDVVKPILDDMLAGFNCTLFAYGQTGTGKTYTMSGDMSDNFGLMSDAAGIIPRVLHALFNKLEMDETENCVRCSFIELYNEELRDLLSADDSAKLKIYDDNSRRGHATTVVQGMEERHITNAAEGLRWLQEGSVRRQVAATKCNDLSSRSHTVFTITVYIKRAGGDGEDYVGAGKLNLVDLAGSENIQRSGAENKRAAEAGLINKSLLTLGRVINALVDRNAHIPYRESKLTRLLQDSLGGRTKTCIIATISPAKSNLEETISTLDYAFRAKNIRNKPQLNAVINKKTLLREFTSEIEKLKGELIATRQRNGVYLSNEAYEDMTVQSESRRILAEEQGAKMETLENNLRNKVQELFSLTSSFVGLKKEHESTRAQLDETREVLDQTELVLAATRKTLAEETHIRRAHEETEQKLSAIGGELLTTLKQTVDHVGGLRAKNKRKSDLQMLNRSTWSMSQAQVSHVTDLVEGRIEAFREGQKQHMAGLSDRMKSYVQEELAKLASTQDMLDDRLARFVVSRTELEARRERSKADMDGVLEEVQLVRDHIKQRVGESLQAIAAAAERIAEDVLSELGTFHAQLHASYSALGRDFKRLFEELLRSFTAQKTESARLRRQVEEASGAMMQANAAVAARMQAVVEDERRQAAAERQDLLRQITTLIHSQADLQESRLAGKTALIRQTVLDSSQAFGGGVSHFSEGMDRWSERDAQMVEEVAKSRDELKAKLQDDWTAADEHSSSIQKTAKSVHAETVRVVDEQMRDLDEQMRDMDDLLARARTHNASHHDQTSLAITALSGQVEATMADASGRLHATGDGMQDLSVAVEAETSRLKEALDPLDATLVRPLATLRDDIKSTVLREYEPTGDTPQKTEYAYPTTLPRTAAHEALLAGMRDAEEEEDDDDEEVGADAPSPSRAVLGPGSGLGLAVTAVFNDMDGSAAARSPDRPTSSSTVAGGRSGSSLMSLSLREVHPNVATAGGSSLVLDAPASGRSMPVVGEGGGSSESTALALFRRSTRGAAGVGAASSSSSSSSSSGKGRKGAANTVTLDGRENVRPASGAFAQSVGAGGRRKSPRFH
ncbi:hypothetical protein P8C59_002856 [Phyllachora maydis]|uniref:Kinesin motor domain-containing protein n=1 Tax=Phyllachora maydis TaxID=1825666 RepID=A0AAD9I084_9PEZI|nr:hypothetical protein P8C59_002856 [Phyllachora maydis]